nr:MAG TPA: Receptor Binding Protein [Caudoviricetes sp.]
MSKIVLYPANGCDFDAADVAAYLAGLTSGVFSGDEDFPVTAAGGLKVTVGAGRGWVPPSRFTGYSITKREADTLTMPLADQSRPRIDRIVMRYDAGARAASLHVLQGTASSTPTAPAISRTELIYDLCLAEITRPAAAASITTGQITDTRLDEALCGIVRDSVTGIPTDELLAAARERIGALEEKATTSAAAAKDSAEAAKSSETKSAASEKNAKTSETAAQRILTDTQNAVKTVTDDMNAAAESASTATTKAGEASTSAGAASASRQAAEKAQKAAENAAALAGTRAGTDKALNTENAPADAAAVGKAFASIIKAYDIALSAASWKATSDTAAKNAGWAYQCDATVSGCTAALEPSATVSLESVVVAQKAGLGSICSTGAGFCRFYAEKVPSASISLRLLLINRTPA